MVGVTVYMVPRVEKDLWFTLFNEAFRYMVKGVLKVTCREGLLVYGEFGERKSDNMCRESHLHDYASDWLIKWMGRFMLKWGL